VPVADWAASGRTGDGVVPFAVDGALRFPASVLEPGKEVVRKFSVYAGPREFDLLKELGAGQEQMLDFGMFGFVSKILLASMLWLHGILGSYAGAIIVLTIVIKSLLWPLQNKSTESMKKMQELQPKMNVLKEKYSDDPQRMNQELMGLYKKHGVNPMAGCLPMFIQIPIFFGFYNMLGKAVELRNSPFLWVHDLSQPDTVAILGGYPVNVLPLIMAATMFLQMQLSPKTGDPMQQRLFMFMPLIFVMFCYNQASGLALYWTVQNIFTIAQLLITNRKQREGLQAS
jgi:YidC/Oxa1 family membrane protein insertase